MPGGNTASFILRLQDRLSGPAKKMAAGLRGVGGALRKIDAQAQKVSSSIGKSFDKISGKIKLAASLAGGLAVKSILEVGAGYEEAISAVGAVSLMTREQIADLDATAKKLGTTTKFTATEAAGAMELMGRAGFKNSEIMDSIGGVLSAAAAEGISLEETANHVSNALKGMGLAADQTTRVADVLALGSARTNSSIGSLGESLANVASTARSLGVPLEDTVAAVALLQDVGLDASVAGSALNVMLTKIAKPTDDIAAKMEKFGITFKDAQGNMLPFQDVLANISSAAEQSGGNLDRVAFLADLVGMRGQKAASNLADLFDSGKVATLTKELYEAGGSAEKMAKLRMDNLIGDWTLFRASVDGVQTSLFETQTGPLRQLVQRMTEWVTANQALITGNFVRFVENMRDVLSVTWAVIEAIATGIWDVVSALLGISGEQDALTTFTQTMQSLADFIIVNRDEIVALGRVVGWIVGLFIAWTAAVKAFSIASAVLPVLFNVIALAVKAIVFVVGGLIAAFGLIPVLIGAAIIGAIALIWTFRDEIGAFFVGLWNWITEAAPKVWEAAKSIGKALMDGILFALDPFDIIGKLKTVAADVIQAARDFFGIHSPSVEFAAIGRYNMEGLAEGTEEGAPMVRASTEAAAAGALAGGGSAGSGSASGGVVINLRPVFNFGGSGQTKEEQKQVARSMLEEITLALETVA
jgi:TP901 family phage tail tape measure protein